MSVGPLEIVIVLVLALLVFGPKGLPQAGKSLGHAMREFRKATQTARTELGLDELTEGVNDLKSSMSVDLGLSDIKSSMNVDLSASALAATVLAAPAADKPVPVAATASDTTPLEVAAETPTEAAAAVETAAEAADKPVPVAAAATDAEPLVVAAEPPPAEAADAAAAAPGASAGDA